jgi:hypothetical protein
MPRMHGQRYTQGRSVRLVQLEWKGEVLRLLVQQCNQLAQLLDDGRMRVKERDGFGERRRCNPGRDRGEMEAGYEAALRVGQGIHRC